VIPRRPHRWWLSLLAALLLGGAAACTLADRGASGSAGTETVNLTVTHRSEWRVLWIEGTADLPDGAAVSYRVTHQLAETAPMDQWPAPNLIDSGRAVVQAREYWARVNTMNWPAGQVRIQIQFPVPPQPAAVTERYGAFGEKIAGEHVVSIDGTTIVQVEEVFDHRR